VHAPGAVEADLAGQSEKIPLHHHARVTSVDCLVMITHVNTNATCFLLFREKSERARTCDWKATKNVNTEDDDTCPGTESGATDNCDDRCNITHLSPAIPRCPSRFSTPKSTRRVQIPRAFGEMQRVSIICISPRGESTAEMSRRDIPRKQVNGIITVPNKKREMIGFSEVAGQTLPLTPIGCRRGECNISR
jgi:hypothetical protein